MSEIEIADEAVSAPTILHEGRYRLYERPDGGIHLVYKRDDKETEDHMDMPAAMIRLSKMASEGQLSMPQMLKEMMKLRP